MVGILGINFALAWFPDRESRRIQRRVRHELYSTNAAVRAHEAEYGEPVQPGEIAGYFNDRLGDL